VRVDLEHDRLVNNVGAVSTDLIGQAHNVFLNFFEISKLFTGDLIRETSVGLNIVGGVVQTHFEGAASTETCSTGKEVEAND
jgi:hypothetical protein